MWWRIYMTKRKKDYLCEFSSDNDNWESITNLKKKWRSGQCVEWLFVYQRMGYMPLTTHLVLQHARIYCEELNTNSKCEYSKFQLQKNDVCHSIKYSNQRDTCSADCQSYTDKFAKTISDENLSPEQIYKTSRSAVNQHCFLRKTLTMESTKRS